MPVRRRQLELHVCLGTNLLSIGGDILSIASDDLLCVSEAAGLPVPPWQGQICLTRFCETRANYGKQTTLWGRKVPIVPRLFEVTLTSITFQTV